MSEPKNYEKALVHPKVDDHEDFFSRVVKKYYFPFLLRYHKYGCLLWLVVFILSIAFGPAFLSLTISDLRLPANAPSTIALTTFNDNYPQISM